MRIRLAKEWAMHDGLSLELALSGFQSPFVRALGKDGRDVKGFRCHAPLVHRGHIWTCSLETSPPKNFLFRRFYSLVIEVTLRPVFFSMERRSNLLVYTVHEFEELVS